MNANHNLSPTRPKARAFTLVELLVAVAALLLMAMCFLPALARTQPDTRSFQCQNNARQLARAWRMYADDNNESLAVNATTIGIPQYAVWAAGWLDWSSSSDNTNSALLTNPRYSALSPYCGGNARLFKCPADQFVSAVQRARGWRERVRSVSKNSALGVNANQFGPSYGLVKKWTELVNPKPAETWLALDEHPDSMNDGEFYSPSVNQWIDLPGNLHDGGAGVSFADGHVEMHRWQGSVLNLRVTFVFSGPSPVPNDPDLAWLRARTPKKPGVN